MGISATDASGKLRSIDDVMLEVADRFAAMPDGAQKTAFAIGLFGKAGAEMIPMLNMGSAAIAKLGSTMTGDFATRADALNDKMAELGATFTRLGVQLGTALLPVLEGMANAVSALADVFEFLPGPVQSAIGVIAALLAVVGPVVIVIGSVVSAIGALAPVIGVAAGLLGGLGGAVATVGSALGVVGSILVGIFTGPVGWVALMVAAGVAVYAFRDKIGEAFRAAADSIGSVVRPAWEGFITWIQGAWQSITSAFTTYVVAPLQAAWNGLAEMMRGVINGVLQAIARQINAVVAAINLMIRGFNAVRRAVGMAALPALANVQIPALAKGGYITGPTVAMVGEGGEPEYVIPSSKMAAASAGYLSGARGAAVLSGQARGREQPVNVTITTGPVMQARGEEWVTKADLNRAVGEAVKQTKRALMQPAARAQLGFA
jgi:phage-related protein